MEKEKLSLLIKKVDFRKIFEKVREEYEEKNEKGLEETELESLLEKITQLFDYALENDMSLLNISDSQIEKWNKSQLEINVEKTLSSLLKSFSKNGVILKRATLPINKMFELSKLDELNDGKYDEGFINYLKDNFYEMQLNITLDNFEKMSKGEYLTKLYSKYKNKKLRLSELISLEEISRKDYTIDSMKTFLIGKTKNKEQVEEFIKQLIEKLEYIYFEKNVLVEMHDVEGEISCFIENMIDKFVIQRHVSDKFSKIKNSGESDSAIDLIVQKIRGVEQEELLRLKEAHYEFMSAENINGYLLESFLARVLEKEDWIWCSGEVYRSVDFCKINGSDIKLLQVKNKYNSENSSSSKIRQGTPIKKWHRLKKGADNWSELHEILDRKYTEELNESKYLEYLEQQISAFKDKQSESLSKN